MNANFRSRPGRRRKGWQNLPIVGAEVFEERRLPTTFAINLPAGGGTFELSLQGSDTVLKKTGGEELFRQPQSEATRLRINGTAAAETLVVDFGSGIYFKDITFNAKAGNDSLKMTGQVDFIGFQFQDRRTGNVTLRKISETRALPTIAFSGLESCRDELTAQSRGFEFRGAAAKVAVGDDGIAGNRLSRLTTSVAPAVIFGEATADLQLSLTANNDQVVVSKLDSAVTTRRIWVSGNDGNDSINVSNSGLSAGLGGGAGNDTLIGSTKADDLTGGLGNDTLRGLDGNDLLNGNEGNDRLFGDAGDDSLTIGSGVDALKGQAGNDYFNLELTTEQSRQDTSRPTLDGGDGIDSIRGALMHDSIVILTDRELRATFSSPSAARLFRLQKIDQVYLSVNTVSNRPAAVVQFDASTFSGIVTLEGGERDDTLIGGKGDDLLIGGRGSDLLQGGLGNDTFRPSSSGGNSSIPDKDTVQGGAGNDQLIGTDSQDLVTL